MFIHGVKPKTSSNNVWGSVMHIEFNTDNVTIALAPAGCGKTHFLRDKVTEAMNTFRPEDVAFVYHIPGWVHSTVRELL